MIHLLGWLLIGAVIGHLLAMGIMKKEDYRFFLGLVLALAVVLITWR